MQSCWKGGISPLMKSTPKIITVFNGLGQSVHIPPPRSRTILFVTCANKRKMLGHLTMNMEATLAVAMIPPGLAMSGYGHFFLLTTVSTTLKSFGCKSSDKRSVSQQSADTN